LANWPENWPAPTMPRENVMCGVPFTGRGSG
jgi:hypothetical protein